LDTDTAKRLVAQSFAIALCAVVYSCALDVDHVPWVLGLMETGRPLHSVFWFTVVSGVTALVITALIFRRNVMEADIE